MGGNKIQPESEMIPPPIQKPTARRSMRQSSEQWESFHEEVDMRKHTFVSSHGKKYYVSFFFCMYDFF